jgi:hypothetical protein
MTLEQASEHVAEISRRAVAQLRKERAEPLRQLGPAWACLIDAPVNRGLNVCAADAKASYRKLFGPHRDPSEHQRAVALALEMFGPQ